MLETYFVRHVKHRREFLKITRKIIPSLSLISNEKLLIFESHLIPSIIEHLKRSSTFSTSWEDLKRITAAPDGCSIDNMMKG